MMLKNILIRNYILSLVFLGMLLLIAAGCNEQKNNIKTDYAETSFPKTESLTPKTKTIEFSAYNPVFKFSAEILNGLEVEYVKDNDSINIYDPKLSGDNNLEKSVIFVRNFTASKFLTLNTVDVLSQNKVDPSGYQAVEYEIKKKPGVANFPSQPSWRNAQHKLTDIRYSDANPSLFYVFAYRPDFLAEDFQTFLKTIKFHNSISSFIPPISNWEDRVTKKPFGLQVSPTDSPISPEKFSGYHTGTDFEILAGEEKIAVPIYALCGGVISKKQTTSGYGGVITQICELDNQKLLVVYGHIDINSSNLEINQYAAPGQFLANLGEGFSTTTDNERKHLHLSIYKGAGENIKGYVQTERELSNWLNFEKLIHLQQ